MAYKDKAAAIAYINQYNAGKYDRVTVMLPHGEKEKIKEHAIARGEKVNGFIKRAIREAIERDGGEQHAHVVVNWLGDCRCSNCGDSISSTSRYCHFCGAKLDEPEQRE